MFFCLYANRWDNPDQCNSNHSRLFGFLTALPAVWRLLQCLRRYYDTRNVFPHLVNGGKYSFTILTYTSLSLYRLTPSKQLKAFFLFAAIVNGFYTCRFMFKSKQSRFLLVERADPHPPHSYLGFSYGLE